MSSKFEKKRLALAVSAAITCSISSMALAEEADKRTLKEKEAEVEVIEVVGMRSQTASSLEFKRLADTVKDVITAEDIGSLPDKSVTEALQRIPGVTIDRFTSTDDPNHFSSEGTGVVVRGLQRVRSEINGRDAFSANSAGGGLSYADIPGELLGRIEVVKNTTADLISGGVAGTVNLVTRKPFDNEGFKVYGQAKASYGDHSEETTPVGNFIISNVWEGDNGKFGALLGLTHSEYIDRGDGVALDSYFERSATARETDFFGENGTEIPGYEGQTLYTPASVAIRSAESERIRDGIVASLQWQSPDKVFELTFDYIYSDASSEADERVVQYAEQPFIINPNNIGVINPTFDEQGFMTAGEVNTDFLLVASRYQERKTDIEDISLNLKVNPNENLSMAFDYQKVNSKNSVRDYTYSTQILPTNTGFTGDGFIRPESQINATGVQFDLTGGTPSGINYTGDHTNPLAPEQALMRSRMDKEDDNDAESDSFAFDVEYSLDDGWISSVKTGVYASRKTQLSRNSDWNWGAVAGRWNAPGPYNVNALTNPELFEQYTFDQSDFFGGGVLNGNQSFLFPVMDNVKNFAAFTDSIGDIADNTNHLANRTGADFGSYKDSEITESEEKRLEAYVQANYVFDDLEMPIMGNFGLRYISWQVESEGAASFPTEFNFDPFGTSATIQELFPEAYAFASASEGNRTRIKGDKYTRILPSFNLSMEMTEDHVMRVAVSENIYLPTFANFQNYRNIRGSRALDRDAAPGEPNVLAVNFSGNVGNPHIEPEESFNIDLSLEWYFNDTGSFNLALFRKDLDNIIHKRLFTVNETNPLPREGTPADAENRSVTQSVAFQQDQNDGSGTITGFELSYVQFYDFLPDAWSGLGMSANYTFIGQSDINDKNSFGEGSQGEGNRNDYRSFKNLGLPGYSDDSFNIALMYEKYDISARLAYSWRSEYLLTRRDADQHAPVLAQATGQMDMSISYSINENFKVGFEGSNLLDEIIETELMYEQNGRQTPRSHFKTDRRFGLWVSASF